MAAFETTRLTGSIHASRLSQIIVTLISTFAAWNDARVTRNALSKLSPRELDDIGLCHGDIDVIAGRKTR